MPDEPHVSKIRIVLADDHPEMVSIVRSTLGDDFEIVAAVDDGRAALDAVLALDPDVVAARDVSHQFTGPHTACASALPPLRVCGFSGFRHKRYHSVGVLAGNIDATIVTQFHVERMHHRSNLLSLRENLFEMEGIAVPMIERNVAIFAPGVRNVEVVAHQCETARNVTSAR